MINEKLGVLLITGTVLALRLLAKSLTRKLSRGVILSLSALMDVFSSQKSSTTAWLLVMMCLII